MAKTSGYVVTLTYYGAFFCAAVNLWEAVWLSFKFLLFLFSEPPK